MSAGGSLGSGYGRNKSQDFELNITSIIDSFTVLIAFMLASASFLSVSVFDAGISAAGAAPASPVVPSINVSVLLAHDQGVTVKLSGKATSSLAVPAKAGRFDYEGLAAQLAGLKAKYPDVVAATLIAESTVEYRDVVRAMEVTRKSLPYVLLGGF